jgi:hypothetical protein
MAGDEIQAPDSYARCIIAKLKRRRKQSRTQPPRGGHYQTTKEDF